MSHFVLSAWVTFFSVSFLASLVFVKGKAKLHKIFSAYSLCIALWALCFTQHVSSEEAARSLLWSRPLHVFAAFIPVLFLNFTFALISANRAQRILMRIITGAAVFFAGLSAVNSPLFISGVRPRPGLNNLVESGPLYPLLFAFFVMCTIYGLWLIWRAYIRASGVSQTQLRYLLFGSLIGYSGGIDNFFIVFDIRLPLLAPFGTYAIPLYVLIASYAIIRYRLMDVSVVLTRFATFILFYLPLLLLPIIGGNVLQPSLVRWIGAKWWIIPTAFEALFAAVGLVTYRYVNQLAEGRVLAEQRRYQATLRRASEGMTRIRKLKRLLKLTVRILSGTVGLTYASIYLADPKTQRYVQQVRRGKDGRPIGDIVEPDDPLIKYLLVHKNAIVAEELHIQRQQTPESGLREVETSLRRLGAALIIPSFVHERLLGFVVMGAKRSGRMYTDDDLKVLATLANQTGLAIENAQFYEAEKVQQAELFHTAQLASLGKMAGGMSHQINNRFYAECIMAGTLKGTWKGMDLTGVPEPVKQLILKTIKDLEKIENDSIRGGDIAKTLLNFSKPGKTARITFPDILKLTTEAAQFRVKFDEIDYEQVIADPLPPLDGNLNQLAEVFFNLMSNAYDAIKKKEEAIKGGSLKLLAGQTYKGKLAISASSIMKNGAPWLRVVVHDTGIGVEAESISSLFIPFFTTKATAEKGTGLGLYVLKKIIENHRGEIEVSSAYGEGTTFTVQLPAAQGAA